MRRPGDYLNALALMVRTWAEQNPIILAGVATLVIGALLLLAYTRPSTLTIQSAVWDLATQIEHTLNIKEPSDRAKQISLVLAEGLERFESRIWKRNFFRHSALALLISAFLILVVDLHSRWKSIREARRDVLTAILGKIVPGEVFKEVTDLILKEPHMRRQLTYVFRFSRAQEPGFLLSQTTISWRTHNLSGKRGQLYPIRVNLHREPVLRDTNGEIVAPRIISLHIDGEEILMGDRLSEDKASLAYDLELPKSEQEFKQVRLEIREGWHDRDRAFWGTISLVEGLVVQWFALDVPGLVVEPYLPHPRRDELISDPAIPSRKIYPGILLPGQGLAIQCRVE